MIYFSFPYFFLLFLGFLLLWFLPKNKYYLALSWADPVKKKFNWSNFIKQSLLYIGIALLIIAATGPYIQNSIVVKKQLSHNYVLVNDASGSMVDFRFKNGIGENLEPLIKGNEVFLNSLNKRDDETIDFVGCVVFCSEAYIVSNLVNDANFVLNKIKNINYVQPPLATGTRIDNGIWAAIEVLLKGEDLISIKNRMHGKGIEYKKDENIIQKINFLREKTKESSIIIFSDGAFFMPDGSNDSSWSNIMSSYKIINLCKDLGIRVYFISVDTVDNDINKLILTTGGFTKTITFFDKNLFEKVYKDILNDIPKEFESEEMVEYNFLSIYFGLCGFSLLSIWFFVKNLLFFNFSEI